MNEKIITEEYYKNFDINGFIKKTLFLKKKILETKKPINRKKYYTELYATYIQVIEIFCINTFVASEQELFKNIFIPNNEIKEKIEERFLVERYNYGGVFSEYLIKSFVFNLKEDKKDRVNQIKNYKTLLKEAVKDYLADFDFLNAYKHGFRVFSGDKSSLSVGLQGKNNAKISNYSSSVSYYKKRNNTIYRCDIYFNWERAYIKIMILLNVLNSIKRTYTKKGVSKVEYFVFDEKKLNKSFGCFRVCSPLK